VGRDGHDRTGPVATQDVVGDVDRDPFAVHRVDRVGPDRDAGLLSVSRQAIDLCPDRRLGDVRVGHRPAIRRCQLRHERVLGREDHERRPEQGVRAGREYAQLGAARVVLGRGGVEDDLATLAPPDPVGLLGLDRFRPLQAAEV
jgi:hypothetical protein